MRVIENQWMDTWTKIGRLGKGEPPYTVMAKPMLVQLLVVKMWDLYGWDGLEIGWE